MDAVKIGEIKNLGILKSNISKLYATKDMHAALKGAPGKFDGLVTKFCIQKYITI